jgi:TonB-linked SusC/RagA family outer membrane protein
MIEKQADVRFTYRPSLISPEQKYSLNISNQKLSDVLDHLLMPLKIKYRIIKNQVVLSPLDVSPAALPESFLQTGPQAMSGQRISGRVSSSVDGSPLPGVNVLLKNTQTGTTTDESGNYVIEVSGENPVLIFSYIGFNPQEIAVNKKNAIDISLHESVATLKEAVVTALGIQREKSSLGYSVGNVDAAALNQTPQTNVLNALAGKVSGVQISQMNGTAGASVNIIIRGANSLNNDNQPLFVIDGVPVANKFGNGFSGADMGNPISDINPNDIANVSILKGPSAAALYGSRAGNGVILITTKSGKGSKKGIGISLNTAIVFDVPYKYVPVQNKFGSGKSGAHILEESENENWGPRLDAGEQWVTWNSNGAKIPLVSYPDRFKDFFQTGVTLTNNIAVNGNYEKGNFRLAVGNMQNKGVVPNTDGSRLTLALNTMYNLTSKLRATANINITESGSDNRQLVEGSRNSPIRSIYETGAQVNILDLTEYWMPGQEGIQQRTYKTKQNNPYFIAYENPTGYKRDRTVSKLQLDYDITSDLSLMGRYARDSYEEVLEAKKAYSNYEALQGGYEIQMNYRKESNFDFIASYNKKLSENWSLHALAGANRLEQYSRAIYNATTALTVPGLYTISNGMPGTISNSSQLARKVLYGVYGSASMGFKDLAFLDLTARNDWSSTLPKENRSYFYPSASVSFILSGLFARPQWLTLVKLRAGSAQVGNDVSPYSLRQTFSMDPDWGTAKRMYQDAVLRNATLKPEISNANEIGLDLKLFENRLNFEGTFYVRNNKNQVLTISTPIESGAGSKLINAGLVQSKGFEIALTTTPVIHGDFRWDMNFTLTRNRTSIKKLSDGITYFAFESYNSAEIRTYQGGQVGDIYMQPLLRVTDQSSEYYGYPLLTSGGLYQADNDVNNIVKIGNFNHSFLLALQPTFTYKNFTLFANIDWRQGGSFYSNSMMFLGNNGQLDETLSGVPYDRDRDIVQQIKENPDAYFGNWVGGRNAEYGGFNGWTGATATTRLQDASFNVGVRAGKDAEGATTYVENLGGKDTKWLDPYNAYRYSSRPFPSKNLYSSTYVKLREIALTYHLPKTFANRLKVQNASISVVGNNLFEWTAAGIGIDPERAFKQSGSTWSQGLEYYNVMPWVGSIGFKLNLDF